MAHRARKHVQARRKRFEPADAAKAAQLIERFLTASATGDLEELLTLLAPDATWTADSGGRTPAARRPVVGARKVAAVLMKIFRRKRAILRIEVVNCNNTPATVVHSGDRPEGVLVEIADGKPPASMPYATRTSSSRSRFRVRSADKKSSGR